MTDWRPVADLATLEKRAGMLAEVRAFFARAGVLEVDVPVLGQAPVTDPHLDNIAARLDGETAWLQTSPEFYMKRLLAAGAGPIYYLGKAFRDGERGRRHNPEFTLLEWYRPGWDEHRLMAEIADLFAALGLDAEPAFFAYGHLFRQVLGVDPHTAPASQLQRLASSVAGGDWSGEDASTCLDLLFSLRVEPAMPPGPVFVYDYPACQSALARLHRDARGDLVAHRFEVFLNGLELGNGYFELTDADEQRRRFEADLVRRKAMGKPYREPDARLLAALESGLPDCAGVAIGFDRLLMQLAGLDEIARVLPFDR
jgi:lysyl-tRNA synthetase class 2